MIAMTDRLTLAWQCFAEDRNDIDARNALWSHYTSLADTIVTLAISGHKAKRNDAGELRSHLYAQIPGMLRLCEPATHAAFEKYGAAAMRKSIRGWYRKEAKGRGLSLDATMGDGTKFADLLEAPTSSRLDVADLEKVVQGMPLRWQMALYFRYVVGWSPTRTARVIGETPMAVAGTLKRARAWLLANRERQFMLDQLLE